MGASPVHAGSAAEQEHQAEYATQGDIAFYPITFPTLIGPGTITTVVEFTSRAKGSERYVALAVQMIIGGLANLLPGLTK